jgi:hypothetical protein
MLTDIQKVVVAVLVGLAIVSTAIWGILSLRNSAYSAGANAERLEIREEADALRQALKNAYTGDNDGQTDLDWIDDMFDGVFSPPGGDVSTPGGGSNPAAID